MWCKEVELVGNHQHHQQAIIYSSINPKIITWINPEHKFNINTVCIQSVYIHNIQEQLLLTVSAENFSDPSNHEKLNLLSKEKGIQEIMQNMLVNKVDNKVLVHFLYNKKLMDFGENFFGSTRRAQTFHDKIYPKPEVALEMDKYIKEQVDNTNYIQTNPYVERQEGHQLHFVCYNFVVLSTSSSIKVQMKTDNSMCTKTCLSLNEVTKPAPGVVPNLQSILNHSRCKNYFAVYNTKVFF